MNTTIQIRKKGSLTLPVEFRNKYNFEEGDAFTLIDFGDGSFLFSPHLSQINRLGGRVAEILDQENISLDDLLAALEEDRQSFYREHYA